MKMHTETASKKSPGYMMRPAVALMVTLFFIMAITVAVGISLTHLQKGNQQLQEGQFMVQSNAVIEDVLTLLTKTTDVMKVQDTATLRIFLDSAAIIPFEMNDLRVKIAMKSSKGKFNLNLLSGSEALQEALKTYLLKYNVQDVTYFVDILLDAMSGTQDVYRTELIDEMPWMYKERIVDRGHFEQLLDFYVMMRHDNTIRSIPWEGLVCYGDPRQAQIDVNYATAELWRLMLPDAGTEQIRTLVENASLLGYTTQEDLGLSEDEMALLNPFDIVYYLPVADVSVMIEENDSLAEITFEYDIASKQAKEFSYDI